MKKIITTVMLAVAAICSTAQAGDFYLGGAVGFMHKSQKITPLAGPTYTQTTNEFSIMPELGYSFNDKWGVGGTIGYTYRNLAGQDTNFNLFSINPYARFTYFRTSNDLIALFIDGSVGFGIGSTSYNGDTSTVSPSTSPTIFRLYRTSDSSDTTVPTTTPRMAANRNMEVSTSIPTTSTSVCTTHSKNTDKSGHDFAQDTEVNSQPD